MVHRLIRGLSGIYYIGVLYGKESGKVHIIKLLRKIKLLNFNSRDAEGGASKLNCDLESQTPNWSAGTQGFTCFSTVTTGPCYAKD